MARNWLGVFGSPESVDGAFSAGGGAGVGEMSCADAAIAEQASIKSGRKNFINIDECAPRGRRDENIKIANGCSKSKTPGGRDL